MSTIYTNSSSKQNDKTSDLLLRVFWIFDYFRVNLDHKFHQYQAGLRPESFPEGLLALSGPSEKGVTSPSPPPAYPTPSVILNFKNSS